MEICTEFNQNPSGNIEGPQLITTFTEPVIMKLVHSRRRFFKKSYAKIHEYSANVLAGDKSHVVEQKDRVAIVVCIYGVHHEQHKNGTETTMSEGFS